MSGRQSHVLCKAQNDTYGGEKRNTWGIGSYGKMSISLTVPDCISNGIILVLFISSCTELVQRGSHDFIIVIDMWYPHVSDSIYISILGRLITNKNIYINKVISYNLSLGSSPKLKIIQI